MIFAIVTRGPTSTDPAMDRLNIRDSSTEQSDQPAMSKITRKLASSLVEMMTSSGDILKKKATASQGRDVQQPLGDSVCKLGKLQILIFFVILV